MDSYGVIRNLRIKGKIFRKLRIQSILEIKLLDSVTHSTLAYAKDSRGRCGSELCSGFLNIHNDLPIIISIRINILAK